MSMVWVDNTKGHILLLLWPSMFKPDVLVVVVMLWFIVVWRRMVALLYVLPDVKVSLSSLVKLPSLITTPLIYSITPCTYQYNAVYIKFVLAVSRKTETLVRWSILRELKLVVQVCLEFLSCTWLIKAPYDNSSMFNVRSQNLLNICLIC